jgi:calcineurin-like phosphoesterase family protein
MATVFVVSDTHFGHKGILRFVLHVPDCPHAGEELTEDNIPTCGCPRMRNFDNVDQMDDYIVTRWNEVVKPKDKVYHIGDVTAGGKRGRPHIATVGKCNGQKRLVRGNHDDQETKYFLPFFEEIYATRVFEDMILSHIPLHPGSIREKWTNVHGHVHNNVPALHIGPKYLNVSVEVTDYRPLSLEEVRVRIRDQKAENQRLVNANLKRLGITPLDEGLEDLE